MNFKEWLLVEYKFSSTQINLDKEISSKILAWSKKNIPNKVLADDGRENEIHVTILYGLHTNNQNEVKPVAKDIKPFTIKLGKISKFEKEDCDVIKIEVKGSEQANKVLSNLPHTNKFKEYVPHCTIAYVKKGSCDHLLNDKTFQGKTMEVNKITFSPKEGSKTTIQLS